MLGRGSTLLALHLRPACAPACTHNVTRHLLPATNMPAVRAVPAVQGGGCHQHLRCLRPQHSQVQLLRAGGVYNICQNLLEGEHRRGEAGAGPGCAV
jgi:hypothetical protein